MKWYYVKRLTSAGTIRQATSGHFRTYFDASGRIVGGNMPISWLAIPDLCPVWLEEVSGIIEFVPSPR